MGKSKKDDSVPTDPSDPSYIRKLTPHEMELLNGGAQPGPGELPEWANDIGAPLGLFRRR